MDKIVTAIRSDPAASGPNRSARSGTHFIRNAASVSDFVKTRKRFSHNPGPHHATFSFACVSTPNRPARIGQQFDRTIVGTADIARKRTAESVENHLTLARNLRVLSDTGEPKIWEGGPISSMDPLWI